mgnify:CR=1 FL=1
MTAPREASLTMLYPFPRPSTLRIGVDGGSRLVTVVALVFRWLSGGRRAMCSDRFLVFLVRLFGSLGMMIFMWLGCGTVAG